MWQVFVINLYFIPCVVIVKSAWVEIPQVPSKRPAQITFGNPKVSFQEKIITTTPYSVLTTTPRLQTTTFNYKDVMTTISPLTTMPPAPPISPQIEDTYRIKPTKETPKDGPEKKDSYSGFLPLFHSIQQILTINAKKSLKSKISQLTNLRDNLLANIDERMSNLWTPAEDVPEARGHDDHDMDFPSNEGALMTIGFLTFAVFLIKLVLKLIHSLKNKQANIVVSTAAPAAALIGRRKRNVEEDSLKILQFIEEYKFN